MKVNRIRVNTTLFSILIFSLLLFQSTNFHVNAVNGSEDVDLDAITAQLPRASFADVDGNWTGIDYSMLIILPDANNLTNLGQTPSEWQSVAESYAEWKTYKGIPALVVNNHTDYEGVDEAEKLRNAILSYYEQYPIEWVLLFGDTTLIPVRYVYNPDNYGPAESVSVYGVPSNFKPTDFYYAELTADWDIDSDGIWGEHSVYVSGSDQPELDYDPEVYVGRFPADNLGELTTLTARATDYEQMKNVGPWMNEFAAFSAISDLPNTNKESKGYDPDGEHEAPLNQYILDNYVSEEMDWQHYWDNNSNFVSPIDPNSALDSQKLHDLTSTSMINEINSGVSIAVFAGHGSPTTFAKLSGSAFTSTQAEALTNSETPTFLYGDACSTNGYDDEDKSLGESYMLNPAGGGIGFIGSMRISWYYPNDPSFIRDNRGNLKEFFYQMFENSYFQQGKALYESKRAYMASDWVKYTETLDPNDPDIYFYETERKTLLSYMLLGDPSVDIFTDMPSTFSPLFPNNMAYRNASMKIQALDSENNPVPYAYLVINNSLGYYQSYQADGQGWFKLQVPDIVGSFNYTLVGHNMYYYSGIFGMGVDESSPYFQSSPNISPAKLSIRDSFTISSYPGDSKSGIKEVFLIFAEDGFQNYTIYEMQDVAHDGTYSVDFAPMMFGKYIFGIIIFDQMDYMNSTFTTSGTTSFSISKPFSVILLEISTVVLAGAVIFGSIALVITGLKKKSKIELS